MQDERCTLFTFMTGDTFSAVLHVLCGLSAWCCLVFPIFPAVLFLLERNEKARFACVQTGLISLVAAALAVLPVVLWLIIRAVTHACGAFYVICTVLFAAVLIMLALLLLAVEVTCAVKCSRHEPATVPFITNWAAAIANKLMGGER